MEILSEFYNSSSIIDIIYIIITILSLIKCYNKGFILSILAMAKWLLAYILTLIIFPRAKPFVKDLIDNEYILDICLGIFIFMIVIFLVLLINKGIGKAVRYTGLGSLDKIFGFFFGFIRSYLIAVCIFSGVHIDEALYRAGIDPKRRAETVSVEEYINLAVSLHSII